MPDKDGNETPAERKRREKKEFLEKATRDEKRRRDEAREEAAWEAALAKEEDKYLDEEFNKLLGLSSSAAADYLSIARKAEPSDKDVRDAMKAIEEGKRQMKKGNKGAAKRAIKKNKDKIKKGVAKGKEAKKKGGCLGAFAGLAAVGAATLYGMYEGVAAIASALW